MEAGTKQLIEILLCIIRNESKQDVLRGILASKIHTPDQLFSLVFNPNAQTNETSQSSAVRLSKADRPTSQNKYIDRQALLQFLNNQKEFQLQADVLEPHIDTVLRTYSQDNLPRISLFEFLNLIMTKSIKKEDPKWSKTQQPDLKYILYLIFVRQLQSAREEQVILDRVLDHLEPAALFRLVVKNKYASIGPIELTSFMARAGVVLAPSQVQYVFTRFSKATGLGESYQQIDLMDFINYFKKKMPQLSQEDPCTKSQAVTIASNCLNKNDSPGNGQNSFVEKTPTKENRKVMATEATEKKPLNPPNTGLFENEQDDELFSPKCKYTMSSSLAKTKSPLPTASNNNTTNTKPQNRSYFLGRKPAIVKVDESEYQISPVNARHDVKYEFNRSGQLSSSRRKQVTHTPVQNKANYNNMNDSYNANKTTSPIPKVSLHKQLQDMSTEIKKRMNYQARMEQVRLSKAVAFIISLARREKEINTAKCEFFRKQSINLAKLFCNLDTNQAEFLTAAQLEEYFQELADFIVFVYGSEGVLDFSGFVKLVAPMHMTLQDVVQSVQAPLDPEANDSMVELFKKMVIRQRTNIKELEVLCKEFRMASGSQLLGEIFSTTQKIDKQQLKAICLKQGTPMSHLQADLLYRKYNRDATGIMSLADFSPYCMM